MKVLTFLLFIATFKIFPIIVFGNSFCVLINDSNNITLQVLDEVVGNIVINNSAYGLALSITCIYIISFSNRKVNKKLRTSNMKCGETKFFLGITTHKYV